MHTISSQSHYIFLFSSTYEIITNAIFKVKNYSSILYLQITAYIIRCCANFFWIDPIINAYTWTLEIPEEAPFVPNLMITFRNFNQFEAIESSLCAGFIEGTAMLINLSNYTSEVVDAIGENKLLRVLIGFINLLSPHRFAANSPLLAAVTPIHSSLLQFLRQYLFRIGNSSISSESEHVYRISESTRVTITPEKKLIAFGRPMEAFDRLPADQRDLLVSMTRGLPIFSRVQPISAFQTRAEWLFAFCNEALNDMRVDEVSQEDYKMRLGCSQQYTPLISELLSDSQKSLFDSSVFANFANQSTSTHV